MRFLLRLIINGVAIWLTALLLGGVTLSQGDDFWSTLGIVAVVALIFSIVNAVIKPIVSIFALPITILTFGLFTLVINALMVLLTSWITTFTDYGLHVDGFWWAVAAGLVISVVTWVLDLAVARG